MWNWCGSEFGHSRWITYIIKSTTKGFNYRYKDLFFINRINSPIRKRWKIFLCKLNCCLWNEPMWFIGLLLHPTVQASPSYLLGVQMFHQLAECCLTLKCLVSQEQFQSWRSRTLFIWNWLSKESNANLGWQRKARHPSWQLNEKQQELSDGHFASKHLMKYLFALHISPN